MLKRILFFIFILCFSLSLPESIYCLTRLYLYQSAVVSQKDLILADIAYIDCDNNTEKIREIIVPSAQYSDNYIDRNEISKLIKINSDEIFFIYGNAVHVQKEADAVDLSDTDYSTADEIKSEYIIKKGDNIRFLLKKNKLSIEVAAVALKDGRIDDEIEVRIKRTSGKNIKTVKGKIISKDQVTAI
jgi:hypothetical protein